jgi:predicted dehydrogenase
MVQRPSIIRKSYGGGVLVCAGSHILDLLHWISGRPTQVCGRMHSRDGLDIDILTNAMLWFENGAIANFEVCWHPLAFAGYERNGWDERLEINTTKGRLDFYTVLWNRPTNNGALLVHQDAVTGHVTEYRYPALNPFDLEMAEFLKCFLTGSPASPSAWDGYVVDEVIAQIKISAIENRIVSLHWQDRTSP